MKSLQTLIVSIVCLGLFLLLLFGGRGVISSLRGLFVSNSRFSELQSQLQALQKENQALRFEVESKKVGVTADRYIYQRAEVYSRYPFNERSNIIVNVGYADGVSSSMPVFLEKGILLGAVRDVRRTQSEVETIFSPTWKGSVSIGEHRVKALLEGGDPPRLRLIPNDAVVKDGDIVENGAPGFPLHATLGTLADLKTSEHTLWAEGTLQVSYTLEEATSVLVLTNFP